MRRQEENLLRSRRSLVRGFGKGNNIIKNFATKDKLTRYWTNLLTDTCCVKWGNASIPKLRWVLLLGTSGYRVVLARGLRIPTCFTKCPPTLSTIRQKKSDSSTKKKNKWKPLPKPECSTIFHAENQRFTSTKTNESTSGRLIRVQAPFKVADAQLTPVLPLPNSSIRPKPSCPWPTQTRPQNNATFWSLYWKRSAKTNGATRVRSEPFLWLCSTPTLWSKYPREPIC